MKIDNNRPQRPVSDTWDRVGQSIPAGDKYTGNEVPISGESTVRQDGFENRELQNNCTVEDAAIDLWLRENAMLDLKNPLAMAQLRERLRGGSLGLMPSPEDLTLYIEGLRQKGLSGIIDWTALEKTLLSVGSTSSEELPDQIDRLASRYVAVRDKLERNYAGEELTGRTGRLERAFQTGKANLIGTYTRALRDSLGISDAEAQTFRDSLDALVHKEVEVFRGVLRQVRHAVAEKGPDRVWLRNHDGYIAAKLREAAGAAAGREVDAPAKGAYSLEDLKTAGKLAQFYRGELDSAATGNRNEVTLAFGLTLADMKTRTIVDRGMVGKGMAQLLTDCGQRIQEKAIELVNQRLSYREANRLDGEPQGAFAPLDRGLIKGICQAVLEAFLRNGGNGAEAIREGAAYSREAILRAHERNPEVYRWGSPLEYCWRNFYEVQESGEMSPMEQQVENLLAQVGKTSNRGCVPYQTYASSWRTFAKEIGLGVDIRG